MPLLRLRSKNSGAILSLTDNAVLEWAIVDN
jgi:hypothetical protein